jgi:hypothetical protein
MNVHQRSDKVKETNLMILFNNETMILGGPKSRDRSTNVSKADNASPRKNGNISARNNNYSSNNYRNKTSVTAHSTKQKRD